MRKLLGLIAAASLGIAGPAHASVAAFTGTLMLQILTLPPIAVPGGGTAVLNGSGGVGHLSSVSLAGGEFGPFTGTVPVTDPAVFPILGINAVGIENAAAAFALGGKMPVRGVAKLCLFDACPSATANLIVPLTLNGTRGVGIGGGKLGRAVAGNPGVHQHEHRRQRRDPGLRLPEPALHSGAGHAAAAGRRRDGSRDARPQAAEQVVSEDCFRGPCIAPRVPRRSGHGQPVVRGSRWRRSLRSTRRAARGARLRADRETTVSDAPNELLDELLACLDLETIDLDIFRGTNERERGPRLFGGQVAAQALVAAGRTVDGQSPHSLHAYFLRPGDPTTPVIYRVDRIRDGKSFSTRHVVAIQRGKAIFNVSVSFQVPETSYEHQMDMPEAPAPEELATWSEWVAKVVDRLPPEVRTWAPRPRPIDMRFVHLPTFLGGEPRRGTSLVWLRVPRRLPDDPFLHQCLLTYASDMSLLDNIVKPHGRSGPLGPLMMASLDHALWFHKPLRVDDWLLYVQDSPAASGGRGFARGTLFTRAGELVASVAQEGLMRPVKRAEDRSQ